MENVVRKMVAHGVQSPDRVIQGVGYPREGVPVGRVKREKGPPEKTWIDRPDERILKNVETVIPIDKVIPESREIDEKSEKGNSSGKTIFNSCPLRNDGGA